MAAPSSTLDAGAGSSQVLALVLPFPYLAGIANPSPLKITFLSRTQSPRNLISSGCSFFQSCMVTDFPNDVPEALQHPGMLSESLREYAVVFGLVLLWSDSHCAFPQSGIKGKSRGTHLRAVGKQKTPVYGQAACPSHFSPCWASARPCPCRCICSALLLSMMGGVYCRGLRPCIWGWGDPVPLMWLQGPQGWGALLILSLSPKHVLLMCVVIPAAKSLRLLPSL